MKEVVVILPINQNQVLLQLRDLYKNIEFQGCWGFFGGQIESGELPEEAAKREIFEEIGQLPSNLYSIGKVIIPNLNGLISHSFFFEISAPREAIVLSEGADLNYANIQGILSKSLYSDLFKRNFPIAPTNYIPETFIRALDMMKRINLERKIE